MPVPPPTTIYFCKDANGVEHASSTPCAGNTTSAGSRPNNILAPSPGAAGAAAGSLNPFNNAGLSGFLAWAGNAANWKHTGLLLAGGLLLIVGVVGLALDHSVSGTKVLPIPA
jgi:hypothetical protein